MNKTQSLEYWQKHREMTAAALNGNCNEFYRTYGYLPKAIYKKRRNFYRP